MIRSKHLCGLFGVLDDFHSPPVQCLCPFCYLVTKGQMWDWRSEQHMSFEKSETLVKPIRCWASGMPRYHLSSCVCDSRWDSLGTVAEKQKERVPLGFWF